MSALVPPGFRRRPFVNSKGGTAMIAVLVVVILIIVIVKII